MKRTALAFLLATLTTATFAASPEPGVHPAAAQKQTPPTEQDMKKAMEATYGAMVPIVQKMTDAILESRLESAAKENTTARIAAFKKNLYDALLREGFAKDEALQITINTPLPASSLF